MFLFQKRFHAGLVDGSITLSFRQWPKARVKPQGRYRVHPIGVLEVDAVSRVTLGDVTDADARGAGFTDRAELGGYLAEVSKTAVTDALPLFRIELHYGGDGDRVPVALDATLSADDVAVLEKKLARLDGRTPWTRTVLALIKRRPRVAASKLAASLGRETEPFKVDVRKLKKLGLTQSFEVGYEVSPRGLAFLKESKPPKRPRTKR